MSTRTLAPIRIINGGPSNTAPNRKSIGGNGTRNTENSGGSPRVGGLPETG